MHVRRVLLMVGILGGWAASAAVAGENELTPQEKEQGWQLLFNGTDHTGWKCSNGQAVAAPVEDGALMPYEAVLT